MLEKLSLFITTHVRNFSLNTRDNILRNRTSSILTPGRVDYGALLFSFKKYPVSGKQISDIKRKTGMK